MADYNLKQIQSVPANMVTRYKDMGDGTHAAVVYVGGLAAGDVNFGNVDVNPRTSATTNTHAPAVNTAAVVTLAAGGAGVSNVVSGIYWSYNATPTGGSLAITDGGTTVFTEYITAGGPGFFPFAPPRRFADNSQVVITLAAAGAAVAGSLNVHAWTE